MAILVAHRGFRTPKGENRMTDFVHALKTCKAVEFDIRMTKDQKIIIFHDHNFKRIAKVNQTVRSLTYQQIKNLNFFKHYQEWLPPLFIDDFVNKIAHCYQMINVEIKPDRYSQTEFVMLQQALNQLRVKTNAEIIVSSFGKQALQFIATLDAKSFKKGYLIESLGAIDYQLIKKFDYLHPYVGTVKQKRNVSLIKKINLPMNIWTFKNNDDVKAVNILYDKKLLNAYISDIADLDINQ